MIEDTFEMEKIYTGEFFSVWSPVEESPSKKMLECIINNYTFYTEFM